MLETHTNRRVDHFSPLITLSQKAFSTHLSNLLGQFIFREEEKSLDHIKLLFEEVLLSPVHSIDVYTVNAPTHRHIRIFPDSGMIRFGSREELNFSKHIDIYDGILVCFHQQPKFIVYCKPGEAMKAKNTSAFTFPAVQE